MTQQLQHRIALGLFAVFSLVFSVNLFLLQPLERSVAFKRMGAPGPGQGLETAATAIAAQPQASFSETAAPASGAESKPSGAPSATVIAPAPATHAAEAAEAPAAVPQVDPSLLTVIVRELGDRGTVTGAAGNPMDMVTRAAIMEAEWDNNLPLTALPSEALLQRIIMGAPGGTPKDGGGSKAEPGEAARDVIRTVQQSLQMLGAGGVKPDGLMGAATARAIRNFEARHKMPQTGRISGALVKRLGEIAGEGKLSDRG